MTALHEHFGERPEIASRGGALGASLHVHHDRLRATELERARRLLAGGTSPERVLDELARRLTNKFLHAPTVALNQAEGPERAELIALVRSIYRLPNP
jgi:glutamyl-tRNA reductase